MALNKKLSDICERLEWTVRENDDGTIELAKFSPAGEDFCFSVKSEDFVSEVMEYATGFDIDDHIELWARAKLEGRGDVPSIRRLSIDAEAIDKMLQELSAALAEEEPA